MKTGTKIITSIITIFLSCAIIFTTLFINFGAKNVGVTSACVRTVDISRVDLDSQSVFNEFEDYTLTNEGTTTYFEDYKTFNEKELREIE